jgi:hypothetical protein
MKQRVVACFVVCLIAAIELPTASAADKSLAEIIAAIRKNEALYNNIEVYLTETYDIGKRKGAAGPDFVESTEWKKQTRSVMLGGKYRVDVTETLKMADGSQLTRKKLGVFDGKTTFALHGDEKQTLAGRQDHVDLVRPHMLLLSGRWLRAPLSVYLSGDKAMRAWPGTRYDPQYFLESEYRGTRKYKGRELSVVRVTMYTKSPNEVRFNHNADEFWLDPKRNFLPVRILAYTFRWSKSLPVGEYEVARFEKIKSGVWFPMSAQVRSWQRTPLKKDGKKLLQWRKSYAVDEVTLNPKHDAKFFAIPAK